MSVLKLSQIEKTISMLSREDQFLLVEKIIHRLRRKEAAAEKTVEARLAEMATDQQIRVELEEINKDFAATEFDGMEHY